MARPTERSAAVLLRSVAYGESDRIVTLLTDRFGKLSAIARGARRSQRRFAGALEPYALVEVDVARGSGDLFRLDSARVVRAFPGILGDLARMTLGAAGLELVRETLRADEPPDDRLVPSVARFFELAEERSSDELRVAFSLRWLSLLGLSPSFDRCGRCGREAPPGKAALFDPPLGAIVCVSCGGGPRKLRGALRGELAEAATRAWDDVARAAWRDDDRVSAVRALDEFVAHHVSRRLGGGEVLEQVREVARRSEQRNHRLPTPSAEGAADEGARDDAARSPKETA